MAITDAEARLTLAAEIFAKLASIQEVSTKIATQVEESVYKQQKEHFLRQQLAAIHKELQSLSGASPGNLVDGQSSSSELDDDEQHEADDMADLKRRIEAMEPGSEERKMGVREWRRLKRIPQGSVENGVIRSYVGPGLIRSSNRLNNIYLARMAHRCPVAEFYPRNLTKQRSRPLILDCSARAA